MPTIPAQNFNGVAIPELRYVSGGYSAVLTNKNGQFEYARQNTFGDNTKILIINTKPYGEITPTSLGNGSMLAASDKMTSVPTNYDMNQLNYTYKGKTVYFSFYFGNPCITNPPYDYNIMTEGWNLSGKVEYVAWLMVYGDNIPDGFKVTYDLVNCIGDEENPTAISPDATITNAQFKLNNTENETFAFTTSSCWIDGQGFDGAPVSFVWEPETGNLKIGIIESDITIHVHASGDPYQKINGESEIPGGGSIDIPGVPGVTATSSGIIGLFAPSVAQMKQLGDYMWTDFGNEGTTTEDILKEIVQAIKRTISNPLDYVVGLNIIPSAGLSIGQPSTIRFGFVNSNVSMPRLTNQYFTVDCGSLSFDTLCGDTFLDYAPYSKFSIYLPYIGFKEVDANDFVGHTISVKYRGDVVTGGVTAYILKDGSVMYQYSGCCALNIPLTADGWGSTIAGAVQVATSIVAGGIAGGAAGVVAGAEKGAANVAANPSLLSPQVMRSGAISGGAGCMGVQHPFVIREAVRFHSTKGFNTVSGYPSYYYKSLSKVSGFTTCLDVHLTNIPGTQGEIAEIERMLKEGVIF